MKLINFLAHNLSGWSFIYPPHNTEIVSIMMYNPNDSVLYFLHQDKYAT